MKADEGKAQKVAAPTSRVAMLWPTPIRDEVRDFAGGRGMTAFVLEAIGEKLARLRAEPVTEVVPPAAFLAEVDLPPQEERVPVGPASFAVPEPVPVPAPAEFDAEQPPEPVAADAPVLGTVAQFSSSSTAFEAMMAKAEALGIRRASELQQPDVLAPETSADEEPVSAPEAPVAKKARRGRPKKAAVVAPPVHDLDDIDAGF